MFFERRQLRLTLVAAALIVLLLFLHYVGALRPVENLFVMITRPVLSAGNGASQWVANKFSAFQSQKKLLAENKELKDRMAILLTENAACREEQSENDFLREQLQMKEAVSFDLVVARVIGHGADGMLNALVLDKGEKHGLKAGQPVLAPGGFLLGKIFRTNRLTSVALLINDNLSRVAAKVQNRTKTVGLVEGKYGLEIRMNLIPQTEIIKEGDAIVTSGLEPLVPAGLVIGEVSRVASEPEELFQDASIASPVEFGKINIVSVIKGIK